MITLYDLYSRDVSPQEVFDQVVAHARQMPGKAAVPIPSDITGGTKCVYRAPDGNRCFAGCLIADSEYLSEFETQGSWDKLIRLNFLGPSGEELAFPKQHAELIIRLQKIHDYHPPAGWEENFKYVASENGLTYTPPAEPAVL